MASEKPVQHAEKRAEVIWPFASRAVHSRHVEALIRMSDDVAESRRSLEPSGELTVHVAGVGQPAKGVRVRARSTELEM